MADSYHERLQAEALAYITEHWGEKFECPVCKNSDWGVSEPVTMELYPKLFASQGANFPVFPVVCQVCANTLFLSGTKSGLFPSKAG